MSRNLPWVGQEPPLVIQRPRCACCGERLRPRIDTEWVRATEAAGFVTRAVSRAWTGEYHGYGQFCTTRCAVRFANAAHRGGYRMRTKP